MHKRIFIACTVACLLWPALAPARPVNDTEFSSYREVSEVKLNAAKESRQKDQEKTESQIQNLGNRIGDIGLYLTWFAGFLTVLLVGFGLIGLVSVKRRASEEAKIEAEKASKEWFKDEGEKLETSLKAARADIKALLATVTQETNKKIKPVTDVLKKEMDRSGGKPGERSPAPSTNDDVLAQADQLIRRKPETDYTFEDWNTRAFNAFNQQNLDAAIDYWTKAVNVGGASDILRAEILFNIGTVLNTLKRPDEALIAYNKVIADFGNASEPKLREQVASTMLNQGGALTSMGKHDEAIAVYDEVVARFGNAPETGLRKLEAMAMTNKGVSLAGIGQHVKAIDIYDDVISRFDDAPEAVAKALFNKGASFSELSLFNEAIDAYGLFIVRFDKKAEPTLRGLVKRAKERKELFEKLRDKPSSDAVSK